MTQLDSEEEEFRDAAAQVARKKAHIKKISQEKNRLQNNPVIPRKKRHITLSEMTNGMRKSGVDPGVIEKRAKRLMEKKQAAWEAAESRDAERQGGDIEMDGDDYDMEESAGRSKKGGKVTDRAPGKNRQLLGMATSGQADKATELRKFAQRGPARLAKAGESDRHVPQTRPKWLLSGKRKGGKTDRR
jgi:nucleolar GTP-binding protein